MVIERPPPNRPWFRAPLRWITFLMSTRRIRLDSTGSLAWTRLDGRRSVAELATELRAELGAEIEPAEERLGLLIRQLRSQDLVSYPGWDAPREGPDSSIGPQRR